MSKTNGEGRSKAEKSGRIVNPDYRKIEQERMRKEEAEWAAKCGPVIVRKVDPNERRM